jgi:DNA-binding Lrp family transcriptional regulator
MTRALVLLTLEPDFGEEPIVKLKKLKGVQNSELLYGPYDAYALIETGNSDDLSMIVVNIRNIDGIQSTLTCFVAK